MADTPLRLISTDNLFRLAALYERKAAQRQRGGNHRRIGAALSETRICAHLDETPSRRELDRPLIAGGHSALVPRKACAGRHTSPYDDIAAPSRPFQGERSVLTGHTVGTAPSRLPCLTLRRRSGALHRSPGPTRDTPDPSPLPALRNPRKSATCPPPRASPPALFRVPDYAE
jgi:hypothetical protein